jgi:hypothetical protein
MCRFLLLLEWTEEVKAKSLRTMISDDMITGLLDFCVSGFCSKSLTDEDEIKLLW